jgi:hypothetical protein
MILAHGEGQVLSPSKLLGTLNIDDWLAPPNKNVDDCKLLLFVWIHITVH